MGGVNSVEGRIKRSMRLVEITDTCWLWQGATTSEGYPKNYVHRRFYELFVGPIPAGLSLDHLCNVRHCVNPEHLEPVSIDENIARAVARRTTCRNGHDRSLHRVNGGRKVCTVCEGERQRRYRRRKRGVA